jgi:hypothetical protein
MLIALVALRLALGAVPAADNPDLKKALQAYDSLDYDQALSLLDKVVGSPDLSANDKITAALYDGIVAYDLGKQDQAHDSLLKAARASPTVVLPDDAPPKLQDFFAKVKAEAAASPAPAPPPQAKPADLQPHPKTTDQGADITEEPKSSGGHTGLIIGVTVAAVVVAGGVVAAILLTQKSSNSCTTASGTGCLQITAGQRIAQW